VTLIDKYVTCEHMTSTFDICKTKTHKWLRVCPVQLQKNLSRITINRSVIIYFYSNPNNPLLLGSSLTWVSKYL